MKKYKIVWMIIGTMIGGLWLNGAAKAEIDTDVSMTVPEIYISAINPGYAIDGKSNVGEMIEIGRRESDTPFSLAGITVRYTNSSGKDYDLFNFPDNSFITGESILLRLASSPDSELASINYTKTLAMSGSLALIKEDKELDFVCWTGKEGCEAVFTSTKPTTLVRNKESGLYEHVTDYEVRYDAGSYEVRNNEEGDVESKLSQCSKLIISEILSYYESSRAEQFVELYNTGAEQVLLNGCGLRYKNKTYVLDGIVRPEGYYAYYPTEFGLTKNPVNVNTIEVIDTNGEMVHRVDYPNGQRKGTAYALIGYDENGREIWKTTYAPTPGVENNYQEYKTCEEGKVINETTGNCVKVASISETICKEGYYLNLLTGRCRKIVSTAEKTCKEGYYLNPETGRCRKIVENKSAEYGVVPEVFEEKSSFVALYAVIGVVMVGVGYLIYEFRHQIAKAWRRIGKR
ncbi:hypothetical protein IJG22_00635 [Candidatus Saccharibacteria bacterium]|nr:hypothetical protein [Candidatus Saccharibacteria bacterium]